ncbi:MAG TPA: hypothetical protein VK610_10310 [Rhodothermales bacterium]|nr:hypothetical protein [Rhodothermales bacterium]
MPRPLRPLLPGLLVLLGLCPAGAAGQARVYVDAAAAPGGDGTSWAHAYRSLGDALTALAAGTARVEVWVAGGTYTVPDAGREGTFRLRPETPLYGGFRGTEDTRAARDPAAPPTVLSGDTGVPGDASDNAYHVVTAAPGASPDSAVVLDGVTVRDGRATPGLPPHPTGAASGGGIYAVNVPLRLRHTRLEENHAATSGGGVYASGRPFTLDRVTIIGNTAGQMGGGVALNLCPNATLADVAFETNTASERGGGLSASSSAVAISGASRFTGNLAGGAGGALGLDRSRIVAEGTVFAGNGCLNGSPCNGGAIALDGNPAPNTNRTPATLADATFTRNQATQGGAVYAYATYGAGLRIQRTLFRENTAAASGGAFAYEASSTSSTGPPNLTFSDVRFERNAAGTDGGAASLPRSTRPLFVRTTFVGNTAEGNGGALTLNSRIPRVVNTWFVGNVAAAGGAVAIYDQATSGYFANTVFVGNRATAGGSAVHVYGGQPTFVNVALAANDTPAFHVATGRHVLFYNGVVWGNKEPFMAATGGFLDVTYAVVQGGWPAPVVFNGDPLFTALNPGADQVWGTGDDALNLRLRPGSPGIDAGLAAFMPPDDADLDGDGNVTEPLPLDLDGVPRLQGAAVDFGPYEGVSVLLEVPTAAPRVDALDAPRPNPTRGIAGLTLTLARDRARVTAAAYDALGRRVAVLHDGPLAASAAHALTLDAAGLPAGTYFVRVEADGLRLTRPVTVVR